MKTAHAFSAKNIKFISAISVLVAASQTNILSYPTVLVFFQVLLDLQRITCAAKPKTKFSIDKLINVTNRTYFVGKGTFLRDPWRPDLADNFSCGKVKIQGPNGSKFDALRSSMNLTTKKKNIKLFLLEKKTRTVGYESMLVWDAETSTEMADMNLIFLAENACAVFMYSDGQINPSTCEIWYYTKPTARGKKQRKKIAACEGTLQQKCRATTIYTYWTKKCDQTKK
uniref:Putative lipocalin lipocalin n=1 Tax=Ixodes ricinus TaxID=34613 RepID=A0A6B0V4G2_IXORI